MSLITPFNILKHELIGLSIRVIESTCKPYEGIEGEVIDETRSMIYIKSGKYVKAVPKTSCKFVFTLKDGVKVEVEGVKLLGRPEDRLKR